MPAGDVVKYGDITLGNGPPDWYSTGLPLLLDRQDLPERLIRAAVMDLATGSFHEAEAAAFLVALRAKGESATELAAAGKMLRTLMDRLPRSDEPVLDTCGTGGDGTGTFNISTAVSLVVAGAGVRVVKHGNRSVSSRSGSADVLTALGVNIEGGRAWAERTLNDVGFAFCFAPHFHSAMAKIAPVRRRLGVRTIFNFLGPLLNPAGAEHQLLGVGAADLLDRLAGALAQLGTRRAFLVHGRDGIDEVSLSGPTSVRMVTPDGVKALEWTPADFGLEPVQLADLRADGPHASATTIRQVLAGEVGPARRIVLANAAAGLLTAGRVTDLRDGVSVAEQAIDSGAARTVLERLAAAR
ncbi:MAG TPA: anthranilate phosphoribosyltransferase [Gemmataceae bacterium]|nr:anthranilate phosphoribosyltransferase [Gemmataceae bacterium]